MEQSLFAVVGLVGIPVFGLVLAWANWDEWRRKRMAAR